VLTEPCGGFRRAFYIAAMLADILDIQVVSGMRVDREGLRRVVAEIVARTGCFQTPVRFPRIDAGRSTPSRTLCRDKLSERTTHIDLRGNLHPKMCTPSSPCIMAPGSYRLSQTSNRLRGIPGPLQYCARGNTYILRTDIHVGLD
jgi:hypothetical protein